MKMKTVLFAFAAYEVAAWLYNSYKVSQPTAAGQAVTGLLPFDMLSSVFGYPTATNPTTVTPVSGYLGRY